MAEKSIKEQLKDAEAKAKASGILPYLKDLSTLEDELFAGKKKKKKKKMEQEKTPGKNNI